MSIYKKLKKCGDYCRPDKEKVRKVAKTGVVALAFGGILVAQTTILGRIATTVANPVLRGVAMGGTIGGTSVASGLLGYKGTQWIFSEDLKRQNEFLDEQAKKIAYAMAAIG